MQITDLMSAEQRKRWQLASQSAAADDDDGPSTVRELLKRGPMTRISTGLDWFDDLLGGGMVPGSVILLHGRPGLGKSTLLSQVADRVRGTLYNSGEESLEQVAQRCARLRVRKNLAVDNETNVESAFDHARGAGLLILDSLQKLDSITGSGEAGSPKQMVAATRATIRLAQQTGVPVILVCHENKAGNAAGPRTVEHDVDVSIRMDGDDPVHIWAVKNRFGKSGIHYLVRMTGRGFKYAGRCDGMPEPAAAAPSRRITKDRTTAAPPVEGQPFSVALHKVGNALLYLTGIVTGLMALRIFLS